MRKTEIRNVLLLTVDCLRFAFLRAGGNHLNVCPTINSLAESGVLCRQARAHGCPSQMTFPGILTSTLPLDYGGYDTGILNRPVTLAESLQYRGLHTVGLTSSPWIGFLYGYNRGFDEFYELFDLRIFWIIFSKIYYKFYRDLREKDIISDCEYRRITGALLEKHLTDLLRQCDVKQRELTENKFPFHTTLHRFDFSEIRRTLSDAITECQRDRDGYFAQVTAAGLSEDVETFVLGKSGRGHFKSYAKKFVDHFLRLFWVQIWHHGYSVPASYLTEQIISSIHTNQRRPFFLWTHFLDIHDKTYTNGPIGLPPNALSMVPGRLLTRNHPADVVRTFSLRFVDNHIARIIATLKSENLLESTLLVICGDHGYGSAALETMAGNLFDESVLVALLFYNPNIKPRVVSEPCGLIDIAPTILDLLGKEPCPEFKGRSLMCPLSSDYPVILESLGPGPCDLRFKAIKMAVVRGKYKLIWREPGYEESCPAGVNYFFDLEADPAEKNNLYSDQKYSKTISELESIVHERCAELRKRHLETRQTDEYLQ